MVMKDEAAVRAISQRVMAMDKETNAGEISAMTVASDGKPTLLAAA